MHLHKLVNVLWFTLLLIHTSCASSPANAPPYPPPSRNQNPPKLVKRGTHVHYHTHTGGGGGGGGGGGMFGSSGGSMAKTIVGGTALAGGAAFAGTAGAIGAHKLFDGRDHDDDDHGSERGREPRGGAQEGASNGQQNQVPVQQPQPAQQGAGTVFYPQQPVQPATNGMQQQQQQQQQPVKSDAGKGVYPVAMLMSDGSYRAIPDDVDPSAMKGWTSEAGRQQQQQQPLQPPRYELQAGGAEEAGQQAPRYYPNDAAAGVGATGGGFVFPAQGA